MGKLLSGLEHQIGDRIYHFIAVHDAPLVEVRDALIHFLGHVASIQAEYSKKQAELAAAKAAEAQEKAP